MLTTPGVGVIAGFLSMATVEEYLVVIPIHVTSWIMVELWFVGGFVAVVFYLNSKSGISWHGLGTYLYASILA